MRFVGFPFKTPAQERSASRRSWRAADTLTLDLTVIVIVHMQVEGALFYNETSCVLFYRRAFGGCVQNENHERYRPLKFTSRYLMLDNLFRCINFFYWFIYCIYRGCYTVPRRFEFYVRVAKTISHSFASLTREILFLPFEHKIHILEPTCNVLFII